jgi:uncharacterized protein
MMVPAGEVVMPRNDYTFLKLAQEAMLSATEPMTTNELWELAVKLGLDQKLGSQGLTPWDSLNARLIVDARDNPNTVFVRHAGRPAKFSLKNPIETRATVELFNSDGARPDIGESEDESQALAPEIAALERIAKYPYHERDLHPFLSWFAKYGLGAVLTKTILHEKSSKRNWTEWLHPDLVGFWFPFEDYNPELLALSGNGLSIARFYSFEMKKELTFSNLRESFFQAVSNSSWANEGFLVAANIDESEILRSELGRLSGSFGIGIIELDLKDPENSQVLFQAKRRAEIDWEGANKLAKENPDFRAFLNSARIDIANCKLHESEYDGAPLLDSLKSTWAAWQPRERSLI